MCKKQQSYISCWINISSKSTKLCQLDIKVSPWMIACRQWHWTDLCLKCRCRCCTSSCRKGQNKETKLPCTSMISGQQSKHMLGNFPTKKSCCKIYLLGTVPGFPVRIVPMISPDRDQLTRSVSPEDINRPHHLLVDAKHYCTRQHYETVQWTLYSVHCTL